MKHDFVAAINFHDLQFSTARQFENTFENSSAVVYTIQILNILIKMS